MIKLSIIAAFTVVVGLPAMAQDAANEKPAGNIFTPPIESEKQAPGFTSGSRPKPMRNRMGGDMPNWEQVKAIPSLTIQQRRELHDLFSKAREQLRPMMQQLKEMRRSSMGTGAEGSASGSAGSASADVGSQRPLGNARGKARELRQQLVSRRKELWEQIKSRLTPAQLQELDLMRKGELVPSTIKGS